MGHRPTLAARLPPGDPAPVGRGRFRPNGPTPSSGSGGFSPVRRSGVPGCPQGPAWRSPQGRGPGRGPGPPPELVRRRETAPTPVGWGRLMGVSYDVMHFLDVPGNVVVQDFLDLSGMLRGLAHEVVRSSMEPLLPVIRPVRSTVLRVCPRIPQWSRRPQMCCRGCLTGFRL